MMTGLVLCVEMMFGDVLFIEMFGMRPEHPGLRCAVDFSYQVGDSTVGTGRGTHLNIR